MRLEVLCPAKVNLFLAVGPVDHRGYHPIRTIFQAIDLFDVLRIEVIEGEDQIVCNWDDLPSDNTLTKTLRFARELIPVPPLRIELDKNIPSESGLGGGSSDAGGLLRAFKNIVYPPPPEDFLFDVAAAVGKDVPFFLMGGRARGEGYGERLTPLETNLESWYVVVRPNDVGCSTREAYRKMDSLSFPFREFSDELDMYNDFERVAPCECLEIVETFGAYGARGALLCGSGSAVFGLFEQESVARMAVHRFSQDARVRVWLAKPLPAFDVAASFSRSDDV